ncbi:hypothetical protein MMC30_006117 [Trapelia coarctata]|nr:hypothetical protein [Trapelia coarctata]
MQQEYKRLYTYHGNKCAASLQGSIKSLFEVVVFVRKADKKLVDWHYRSDRLKTALRLVGLDRRTHAVIEEKTQKLQDKVQRVEKKFDQTGVVFDGGLQEAKRMRSGFLEFSTGNVEKVSEEVLSTRDAYGQEYERVDILAKQQGAEHKNAQSKAENLTKSLEETKQSHDNAEWSRTAWSAGTVAGLGAAAVSAFVFPPSLLTTAPLLVASAAAGRTALPSNEGELARSSRNLDACSEAIEKVDEFQCKSEILRVESQRSLNELYVVQTVLDKTREKLRIISKELHECRYGETRRGIAGRLCDVLGAIQDVPKKVKSANAIDIGKAICELTEIDKKTGEVLQIAKWSAQAHSD